MAEREPVNVGTGSCGYTCFHCGNWVPNNTLHACPTRVIPYPSYAVSGFRKLECAKCRIEVYEGQEHTVTHRVASGNEESYYHAMCCPLCPKGGS